jgi:threonyl-tRNA synthetase
MPAITLPDGSVRQFDAPVTGTDVAAAIGPGLARVALAMKLDGKTVDLATSIDCDAAIVHHAPRPQAEYGQRHAAHVLAEAGNLYQALRYRPADRGGFYYDFARNLFRQTTCRIESKMHIIGAAHGFGAW